MDYWSLPKEEQDRLESIGVDYDLRACLEHNPQPFDLLDIVKIMSVVEGENDTKDWFWVVKLKPKTGRCGNFALLLGGCDYTGWDCQSWAKSAFFSTARKAAIGSDCERNSWDSRPIAESLLTQLKAGKAKTWTEKKADEFGKVEPEC